jgi:hypothetical protein
LEAISQIDDQRAFIADQRRLTVEQHHHLQEQFKSLRLTIWEKRAGILLRVATAAVGIGIACFLGAVVWNAAHDDGLIVESFSVPPDLAARGLTGQVVAGQLVGNLSSFRTGSLSVLAGGRSADRARKSQGPVPGDVQSWRRRAGASFPRL